jgi:biotin carboxyl carrier protein
VLRVEVAVGDTVHAGQGVVVLEAMKMENELKVPVAGRVTAIRARAGQPVDKGVPLVEVVSEG